MRAAWFSAVVPLFAVADARWFTNTTIVTLSYNTTTSPISLNSSSSPRIANTSHWTALVNATSSPGWSNVTALIATTVVANSNIITTPTWSNATFSAQASNATASAVSIWRNNTTPSGTLNDTITRPPIIYTSPLYSNSTTNAIGNGTRNVCQAEFDAYETAWWWWEPTTQIEHTQMYTWNYELTTYSTELYECTMTCGSLCYAGPVTTVKSTTVWKGERLETVVDNPPFPIPAPTCTIPFDECLSLQTSYSSAITSFSSMDLEYQAYNMEPVRPYCSACISTGCHFNGMFAMSLFYWPPTTSVSRDYCATAPVGGWASNYVPDYNHTYKPTTTGRYAVTKGITMYEGNVYISYIEPRVNDNCGSAILRRNPETNRVITIASEDLHSIRSYPNAFAPFPVKWDLVPWPVNYDDFNGPPTPWSAYSGQQKCAQAGYGAQDDFDIAKFCGTLIKPDDYFPDMMMPPQIRNLDPAWATCDFDSYAAYDPPIALTPVNMFSSAEATPTPGGDLHPIVTPAIPGQPGGGGMPVVTGRPEKSVKPQKPSDDEPFPTQVGEPSISVGAPLPSVTIGSSVIPVDPSNGLIVRPGITLRPQDAPATVDGTTFSFGPSGVVVEDPRGRTTFSVPSAVPQQPVVTVGTSVFPINVPGQIIIKPGVTLKPGQPPVTVDGTTMSLGTSGVVMLSKDGSTTVPIPAISAETPPITVGPSVVPFDASGGLIIRAGQTLRPGDPPIAISGTTYSIGISGVTIIDHSGTKVLPLPVSKEYITIGSNTYTLVNGKLIMGERLTLSGPGGMVVFAGTTVILKSGSVVAVSKEGTSVIPVKSKADARKTDGAGVTGAADGNGAPNRTARSSASITSTGLILPACLLVLHLLWPF
ncbi:hypothetical protein FB567DRAFT_1806 [Paraphoma chrysanthemicola]|uniref:Uncharacterized protein n=1 Tax=Paraphoma chrysanthemicola TaxID=798071 RepID=A0A8K0W417_9PLEO|nr:hypothetical protein FB567DRAFT_1806 [Paraphoma chrysanthemicola]